MPHSKKIKIIIQFFFRFYLPLFRTEIGPRLANHFCELTFSIRVEWFELIMLFSKEEIVTTSVRFWVAGISPSFASPPSTIATFAIGSVWYDSTNIIRLAKWSGRARIVWMIKHPTESLWTQLHRHQITTVKFPIYSSNCCKTRLACIEDWMIQFTKSMLHCLSESWWFCFK